RLVSKEQLFVPIYAFSPREAVRRRLTILRDVVSYLVPKARTVEDMIQSGDDILLKEIHLAGAAIVETSGMTPMEGATNTLRIRRLAAGPRPAPPKRKPKPAGT
ncbi:MAG: hypothetical protein JNK60_16900, partial [Acidobacteria bacterium]|nr:hypothetical protein [Acidobacteriota bacterium]